MIRYLKFCVFVFAVLWVGSLFGEDGFHFAGNALAVLGWVMAGLFVLIVVASVVFGSANKEDDR